MKWKIEDHYEIVWLREQGKSYRDIVEITGYTMSKVKQHLLAKNS